MQNIVTLGEINDALKFTTVNTAQLAGMGFAPLDNKPICEALPTEQSRRLRNAKLYPAESVGQIRIALAQRLAAPAACLHQIQEPAPVLEVPTDAIQALRSLHDSVELAMERGALSERALEIIIMQPATDVLMRAASQAAPAAVAVPMAEAWEQSAADTEQQTVGVGQDYNQGLAEGLRICAKDLRAALAATPADHVADAGKMVAAASRTTGYVAPKGRYVPPVLFSPYTGEPRDARDIASDPQGVLIVPPGALLTASSKPAAETVVLPEPFTTLVRKTSWSSDCYEASPRSNAQEYGRQWADERINVYTEQQVRALLAQAATAAAPAHPAEGVQPAAGQCRFKGYEWGACHPEHVAMVLRAPEEWPDYEVRYLYAAPAPADALATATGLPAQAVEDGK